MAVELQWQSFNRQVGIALLINNPFKTLLQFAMQAPNPSTKIVRIYSTFIVAFLTMLCTLNRLQAQDAPEPNEPVIEAQSDEASLALQGFRVIDGVGGKLFAAEPLFANPVAFYVDDQGRVFVCETFRQGIGVVDNRNFPEEWVDADLAAQTVEDRRKYHLEQLGDRAARFMEEDDQIRVLIDKDKDGVADESTVFANRFNGLVDGTGAGVLEYRGNVYYTCIPSVYLMRDEDGDNQADGREVLHTGYGVRVAFRGHDLHGLVIGPDGRLYFSIGDRGATIETENGVLKNAESGSVFRCELDGSNLEIFATGLRNPQELAFDENGNLFTCDNNSDSGDQARWVYVLEDGDTGWRMAYQYLADRGPFNRERIWEPLHEGQPAYIVPPIRNISDGPSGLEYYPGTGFGDVFKNKFLLADFRGTASKSGIRAIRNEADGAFFKIAEDTQPFWEILATDLQFGPDGGLYVSDWVNGWEGEGKGRIYRFFHEKHVNDAIVKEVQQFLAQDISQVPSEELAKKLNHIDRRVRQKSQLELAARGDSAILMEAATSGASVTERLHGIWGLDHLARTKQEVAKGAIATWLSMTQDADVEIRAHTIRLLGEHYAHASEKLAEIQTAITDSLVDSNARVRYFAMVSARKAGVKSAFETVVAELESNHGKDPAIRHAGVMALVDLATETQLLELRAHKSIHVRLAAVVALRRLESASIAKYLKDKEELVVAEAARAIHDVPITSAMKDLAALVSSSNPSIVRRALDANYRLGGAATLANYIAEESNPDEMRKLALDMLSDWAEPSGRDKVTGLWQPIEARSSAAVKTALEPLMASFRDADSTIRLGIGKVASELKMESSAILLRSIVEDNAIAAQERADALVSLASLGAAKPEDVRNALQNASVEVRAAALTVVSEVLPDAAQSKLAASAMKGEQLERQTAIRVLGEQDAPSKELIDVLKAWAGNELPKSVHLEALAAAETHQADAAVSEQLKVVNAKRGDAPSDVYVEAMEGGNAAAGAKVFWEKVSVSCVRCHQIGGDGGEVGPDLTRIGKDKDRRYLLEAIVEPNKAIAKGFESALILDIDDQVHTGVVREETEDSLTLVDAEGRVRKFDKDDIEARNPAKSGMPADLVKNLTKEELRDLIEYLSTMDGSLSENQGEVL